MLIRIRAPSSNENKENDNLKYRFSRARIFSSLITVSDQAPVYYRKTVVHPQCRDRDYKVDREKVEEDN